MTTILADARLGVMVADSLITDEDRVWTGRKVWRVKGVIVGVAGNEESRDGFLTWIREGMVGKAPAGSCSALLLGPGGLFFFEPGYSAPLRIEHGVEAIGKGAKAAMCAYEALGFNNPRRAVQIVCKHDASSRGPVRTYKLKA